MEEALQSEKNELEKSTQVQTMELLDVELSYNAKRKIYSFKYDRFKFNQKFKNYKEFCLDIAPMKQIRQYAINNSKFEVLSVEISNISFKGYRNLFDTRDRYHITVVTIPENLHTIESCLSAISLLKSKNMQAFFANFESAELPASSSLDNEGHTLNFYNENIQSNAEQAMAVKSIVASKAFPFPYVVFGPPGMRTFFSKFNTYLITFKNYNCRNWKDDSYSRVGTANSRSKSRCQNFDHSSIKLCM